MSRGRATAQGATMNPLTAAGGGGAIKGGSRKAGRMAASAFNDEDLL